MSNFVPDSFDRLFHCYDTRFRLDRSKISMLSTHGCVEGRLVGKHRDLTALGGLLYHVVPAGDGHDLRILRIQLLIPDKRCLHRRVQLIIHRCLRSHVICLTSGLPSPNPLCLHLLAKSVHVHGESVFLQNFFCQICGESIGVIELKRFRPRED